MRGARQPYSKGNIIGCYGRGGGRGGRLINQIAKKRGKTSDWWIRKKKGRREGEGTSLFLSSKEEASTALLTSLERNKRLARREGEVSPGKNLLRRRGVPSLLRRGSPPFLFSLARRGEGGRKRGRLLCLTSREGKKAGEEFGRGKASRGRGGQGFSHSS